MYSVYAVVFKTLNGTTTRHEVLIHDNMSPIHEQHLIDPSLKMADLEAGQFTATIPPYNPGYSLIERFNSIIKVQKGTRLIWTGRVMTETMDFWNRRAITCEGALAFLNDTVQPIAYYGKGRSPAYILSTLLNIHNQKTVVDRKIYPGSVDDFLDDEFGDYIFETNNETTFEALKKNITDRLNCHISMHYSNNNAYIDIYSSYPNTAIQQINFGDNLLDFTKDWNLSGLVTTILPRGKAIEETTNDGQKTYLTLKSSNDEMNPIADGDYSVGGEDTAVTVDGLYLINNSLYSQYGRVEKVVDFSDSEDPEDLFILAKNYITSMQFDNMTLKVNAVDLHNLTKDIVSFNLLDQVYCISKPHGLYGRFFPIVEVDIPLDRPDNVTYTLSDQLHKNTLTGAFGAFKAGLTAGISKRLAALDSTEHILDLAKIEASSILNRKTTGYVSIINMHDNEDEGVAQALVISNTPNWRESSKYWIWNMNGLGYYDSERSASIAYTAEQTGMAPKYTERDGNKYYDLAITMDGTIVANRIKTGIISDGYGLNYWNLETGAFSLMPGAQFYYGGGDDDYVSIFDILYGLDKSANRKSGSTNYLSGSKDWTSWYKYGNWEEETQNNASYVVMKNIPPSGSDWGYLRSPDIPYPDIKGYTMTLSIEGTISSTSTSTHDINGWGDVSPTNAFVVIFALKQYNSSQAPFVSTERVFTFENQWCRRYVVIDVLDELFGDWDYNDNMNYFFSITFENRSKHRIQICKPQFERGNVPTDWSASEKDINNQADEIIVDRINDQTSDIQTKINGLRVKITTEINDMQDGIKTSINNAQENLQSVIDSANMMIDYKVTEFENKVLGAAQFTDRQVAALDAELNCSKILDKLSNNGRNRVLYMENNTLYIDATYIKTGALRAGLLTTGIIKDQTMNNWWDLELGYMKVTNGEFENTTTSGQISSDNGWQQIELTQGAMNFYWNNKSVGRITTLPNLGQQLVGTYGNSINVGSQIMLESPTLVLKADNIVAKNDKYGWWGVGVSGGLSINYVSDMDGSGYLLHNTITLNFVQGLFTGFTWGGADNNSFYDDLKA